MAVGSCEGTSAAGRAGAGGFGAAIPTAAGFGPEAVSSTTVLRVSAALASAALMEITGPSMCAESGHSQEGVIPTINKPRRRG